MQQPAHVKRGRHFSASEVAEFEYCPLAWWYEQYEPMAREDSEDLFAHLVELEHDHGSQAPALPEYQMVERLLLRKGAFDEGHEQHLEHADEVEELQEERVAMPGTSGAVRTLALCAAVIFVLALLLIGAAFVMR
jgi:hypothetical protein